ncbi:MAG: tripartite tricarboxylate transporter substrate binding protein [Deltaproteobacteria bacterium]|nr:tripartite tricarboxylate transporter substrate binding protein [Deltaproteobacteria bacterium]
MKYIRTLLVALVSVLVLTTMGFAADTYPSRPIELVVPFSPGGGSDIFARTFVKFMQEEKALPVNFNVVNKPGGSGVVGYNYVAGKKGDPYTMATVSSSFWATPIAGQSPVSYKDFTPVAGVGYDSFMLITRVQSPYQSMQDVIAAAKKDPGKIKVSVPAIAADDAVVTNMLERAAGVKFNMITFDGNGPALLAALGGHVDLTWSNAAEVLVQIEAKKIRVLAVATSKRMAKLPNVPTLKEMGYNVEFAQFRGLVMPKDVPPAALKTTSDAVNKLCKSQRWQTEYVEKNVITGVCQNSEEFGKAVVATNDLYKKVFAELGIGKK